MMRRSFFTLLLAGSLLPNSSFAKKEPWMKEVNLTSAGPHLKINPTKLEYTMSWNGAIKSGNINILIGKKDKRYPQYFITQIYGGSSGVARGLYRYDTNMVSFLNKKSYRPISFLGEDFEKGKKITTTNRYKSNKVDSVEVKKDKKGKVLSTKKKSFSYPGTFDLASSMLYVRSLDLKKGMKKSLVVQPFKSPYLVKINVLGKEKHLGKDCFKLDIKLQKIRSDLKLAAYKKLKKATLWITADKERTPLELRTKVFIGDVRMTLKKKSAL